MTGASRAAMMQSPTLTDMIRLTMEAHSNLLRVAMPATVISYNSTTHKATVQPSIQYRREGGETQTLAPIAGVPVIHPRTQAGAIYLPVAKGDCVTLLVSDRDLSGWKAGSGQTNLPNVIRAHDLADCWAIPGGYPDGKTPRPRYTDALEIWLKEGTKFAVGNGAEELIDLLVQTLDLVLSDTHTCAGSGNQSSTTLQATQWNTLKAKLETFKAG